MSLLPSVRMISQPLHGTMQEARLANFVTATAEGLIASPLPLFLAPEEGPYGTLYGHLARANPQWKLPPAGGRYGAIHGAGRLC
jgi:predicted FMN-binding regulatory protein PaiB